jgi:hypothetical protein
VYADVGSPVAGMLATAACRPPLPLPSSYFRRYAAVDGAVRPAVPREGERREEEPSVLQWQWRTAAGRRGQCCSLSLSLSRCLCLSSLSPLSIIIRTLPPPLCPLDLSQKHVRHGTKGDDCGRDERIVSRSSL